MQTLRRTEAAILALLSGISVASADDKEIWRLFVTDHKAPAITIINAIGGQKIGAFQIKGPASLCRRASGKIVLAVQGAAGTWPRGATKATSPSVEAWRWHESQLPKAFGSTTFRHPRKAVCYRKSRYKPHKKFDLEIAP